MQRTTPSPSCCSTSKVSPFSAKLFSPSLEHERVVDPGHRLARIDVDHRADALDDVSGCLGFCHWCFPSCTFQILFPPLWEVRRSRGVVVGAQDHPACLRRHPSQEEGRSGTHRLGFIPPLPPRPISDIPW